MDREVRNGNTYYTDPWPEDGNTQSALDELIASGVPGVADQKEVHIEVPLPRVTKQEDGLGGYLLEIVIPGDDQVILDDTYSDAAEAAAGAATGGS